MKDLLDRLAVVLVRAIVRFRMALGPKGTERLASSLGWFWFSVLRARRAVALDNAELVFGDRKSAAEKNSIIAESFRHWVRLTFDLAPLLELDRDRYLSGMEVEGADNLRSTLGAGRGAVLISSHYGGFPILSAAFPHLGAPFYWLSRRPKGRHTRAFFDSWLERTGCVLVEDAPRHRATAGCLRALHANGCVCFLIDHHFPAGQPVPFFGHPARTALGPALFSVRAQAPALPVVMRRLPDGRYRLIIEKPIAPPPDSSEGALKAVTEEYSRRIESWIEAEPAQWFWIHRRWKVQQGR